MLKRISQYLHEILTLVGKDRRKLPFFIVLFILSSLIDLVGLGLIMPYTNMVLQPNTMIEGRFGTLLEKLGLPLDSLSLLPWASGLLISIFLLKAVAVFGIHYKIIYFSHVQKVRLVSHLMQNYLHLPYPVYLRRNSAEYVYAVQKLTGIFQGILQTLLRTISDFLVAGVIFVVLAWQNVIALSLLVLLLGCVSFLYDHYFRHRMRSYGKNSNIISQRNIKVIHEAMEGFKEIRILGCQRYFHRIVKQGAEDWAFYNRRHSIIIMLPSQLMEIAVITFVILLVLLSNQQQGSSQALIGTVALFGVAAMKLKPIVSQLASAFINFRFNRDGISRLYQDVLKMPNTLMHKNHPNVIPKDLFKSLELNQISFSYPEAIQPAIQNLSLKIRLGESIGLIGPSGSGKTTLVDVLLGLLKTQSGTLEFNGSPLNENLLDWRSQVAYLPQQVFLIDNTLRCNVALGEEESAIDEDRLKEALHQARLSELVDQLPQGVNTLLGERGVRLSGGQRQRVALARAFYHGRNVLVMDESTSSLDYETEKEIVAEIQHLKGRKTMIVIAHRLTTVRHCDRIYRLENGRIIEEGTPEQVLSKDS